MGWSDMLSDRAWCLSHDAIAKAASDSAVVWLCYKPPPYQQQWTSQTRAWWPWVAACDGGTALQVKALHQFLSAPQCTREGDSDESCIPPTRMVTQKPGHVIFRRHHSLSQVRRPFDRKAPPTQETASAPGGLLSKDVKECCIILFDIALARQ